MKFHLNYTPAKPGFEIDHTHALFLTGSCFSENIGQLLTEHKFKTHTNPSGILFNPLSIYKCLSDCITLKPVDETLILQRGDSFLSYGHHSSIHAPSQNQLLETINAANKTAHDVLKNADQLMITFGSAYYYQHTGLNAVVANCHKQPGALFEKKLMAVDEIVTLYSNLIKELHTFNPGLKIMFTVSPVKHLKDGVIENNISKSTLLLSVHQLTAVFNNSFYFPAYELVNDDLRDYRFYKEDLAHPNALAIDYVWQKFSACFFSDKTTALNQKIAKLNLALHHRDMHNNSSERAKLQEFIAKQKEEIIKLNPGIEL